MKRQGTTAQRGESANTGDKSGSLNQIHYQFDQAIPDANWYELLIQDTYPPKRGYHSTFEYGRKVFIFGGKDISQSLMSDVWCLDCSVLIEFYHGESEFQTNPKWEQVNCSAFHENFRPQPMCYHTSIVYDQKMYLFGGSSVKGPNMDMYSLELKGEKYQWQMIKSKPLDDDLDNLPRSRDEHTALIYQDSMWIFGGFTFGQRTNQMFKYTFKTNTWEKVKFRKGPRPCPRAGHSAVLQMDENGDFMYIFAGKQSNEKKLNDLWKLNMATFQWTEIQNDEINQPAPRSGHSACIYKSQCMVVYGGIQEVTKELNDTHVFDFAKQQWLCISPQVESPTKKPNKLLMSPGTMVSGESQQYHFGLSDASIESTRPSNFLKIMPNDQYATGKGSIAARLRMKKPGEKFGLPYKDKNKTLISHNRSRSFCKGKLQFQTNIPPPKSVLQDDPYSMILQNSYIIQNLTVNSKQQVNFKQKPPTHGHSGSVQSPKSVLQKQQTMVKGGNANQSISLSFPISPSKSRQSTLERKHESEFLKDPITGKAYTKIAGRRPKARDGHTGIILGTNMIIFGGDRHTMPFNDAFMLDLESILESDSQM